MADLLKARGLCKSRDGFELKDVDLTVPEGGVVGFIGANGAGKTTTIQAVLGLIGRDGGSVELFGNRMDGASEGVEVAVKNRIGVVFDSCSFPDTVNVAEAGCCMAAVYGQWDADGFASLCASFELPEKRKIKELSRGMGMKLMLAVALSHGADLLLLDEATAGLDPMARDELLDILRGFMETEGRGILMSSHITSDLERIADYIVCIDEGQVVFACKKDDITESAGIARCRADQLDEVAASGLFEAGELYYSQHKYGVDVLAGDRAAFAGRFPEMVLDRMTIDDYMALRLKGERTMKAMLKCDLICLRSTFASAAFTAAFVGAIMLFAINSLYAIMPCVVCCVAVTVFYNLLALDEMNGWQRYRLTLPLTRRQAVAGRFASGLVMCCVALVMGVALTAVLAGVVYLLGDTVASGFAGSVLSNLDPAAFALAACAGIAATVVLMALTLPLAMKLGLTKAVRALPIAYLLVVFAAVMAAQGMFGQMDAASVLGLLPEGGAGLGLLAVLMLAVALALYGGSYVVTRRLYAKREL